MSEWAVGSCLCAARPPGRAILPKAGRSIWGSPAPGAALVTHVLPTCLRCRPRALLLSTLAGTDPEATLAGRGLEVGHPMHCPLPPRAQAGGTRSGLLHRYFRLGFHICPPTPLLLPPLPQCPAGAIMLMPTPQPPFTILRRVLLPQPPMRAYGQTQGPPSRPWTPDVAFPLNTACPHWSPACSLAFPPTG